MVIDNLLNGIKRTAVRGALGLALLVPTAHGCGDTYIYNGSEDTKTGNNGTSLSEQCAEACQGESPDAYACLGSVFVAEHNEYREVGCFCKYAGTSLGGAQICQSGDVCCAITEDCAASDSECK